MTQTEITHDDSDQLVSPARLRQILAEDGEECYCAPSDWDPNVSWDVAGECPAHGEIWHPASGVLHPDDEVIYTCSRPW